MRRHDNAVVIGKLTNLKTKQKLSLRSLREKELGVDEEKFVFGNSVEARKKNNKKIKK